MFSIVDIKELHLLYSHDALPRYQRLVDSFQKRHQTRPDFIARAPGRVNIIGEHIDYEGYGVLPAAIEKDCLMAVKKVHKQQIEISHVNGALYPAWVVSTDPHAHVDFVDNYVKYFWAGYRSSAKHLPVEELTGMQIVI